MYQKVAATRIQVTARSLVPTVTTTLGRHLLPTDPAALRKLLPPIGAERDDFAVERDKIVARRDELYAERDHLAASH